METGGLCSSPCGGLSSHNFEAIVKELGDLARKQAQEYFRVRDAGSAAGRGADSGTSNDAPSCDSTDPQTEGVVETYRMLIFPEKTLLAYFRSMPVDDLKREFRRLAMLIHPDKNGHPSAKQAFQKLYNNFIAVSQPNN